MFRQLLTTLGSAAALVAVLSAFALAGWGGGRARADEPTKQVRAPLLDHLRPGSPKIDAAKPCPVGPGAVTYENTTRPIEAPKAVVKRWYQLIGQPGWYGYGALDSKGRVIVEQRRYVAPPPPAQARPPCTRPDGKCPFR